MGSHPQVPASGMRPLGPVFINRMHPTNNGLYGQFGNILKNGQGYGSIVLDFKLMNVAGCPWITSIRYMAKTMAFMDMEMRTWKA